MLHVEVPIDAVHRDQFFLEPLRLFLHTLLDLQDGSTLSLVLTARETHDALGETKRLFAFGNYFAIESLKYGWSFKK